MTIRALAAAVAVLSLGQATSAPDLILHNARVYTVDANRSTAEAIAVRGNRIVRVGGNRDLLALRGPSTRVIDARAARLCRVCTTRTPTSPASAPACSGSTCAGRPATSRS